MILFQSVLFQIDFLECLNIGYVSSYLPKLSSDPEQASGAYFLHIFPMIFLHDNLSIYQVSIPHFIYFSKY